MLLSLVGSQFYFYIFIFIAQKNIFILLLLFLCHHSECTYGFYATCILTWGLLVLTFLFFSFQDDMNLIN